MSDVDRTVQTIDVEVENETELYVDVSGVSLFDDRGVVSLRLTIRVAPRAPCTALAVIGFPKKRHWPPPIDPPLPDSRLLVGALPMLMGMAGVEPSKRLQTMADHAMGSFMAEHFMRHPFLPFETSMKRILTALERLNDGEPMAES